MLVVYLRNEGVCMIFLESTVHFFIEVWTDRTKEVVWVPPPATSRISLYLPPPPSQCSDVL